MVALDKASLLLCRDLVVVVVKEIDGHSRFSRNTVLFIMIHKFRKDKFIIH